MDGNQSASSPEPTATEFQGMDPYLEIPGYWQGFHNLLIAHLNDYINQVLPTRYIAVVEQRLVILPDDQISSADIAVIKHPVAAGRGSAPITDGQTRGLPDGIFSAFTEPVYDWFIEIRTTRPQQRRVITIIEVLSPTNKAPATEGRREYQRRQNEIMHGDSSLLEIDLLRQGAHTVAAPLENLAPRETWDYIVSLHRITDRYRCGFWLNRLSQPLPEVLIPLSPDDPDVHLDLQAVYRETYVKGRYPEFIDYSLPLPRS